MTVWGHIRLYSGTTIVLYIHVYVDTFGTWLKRRDDRGVHISGVVTNVETISHTLPSAEGCGLRDYVG